MSIEIHMRTPQKKQMAGIFRAIAEDIEASANETISIDLKVTYNKSEAKKNVK